LGFEQLQEEEDVELGRCGDREMWRYGNSDASRG
jgi:hypothetical protein